MKKFAAPLLFLLFIGCQNNPKRTIQPFEQLSLFVDQYANESIANGNINSMSIGIYKDGKTYHQYYGSIDSTSTKKPNDSSLFEIASISKTFVGTLMAKAVSAKKVSLDDDIRSYLPKPYSNLQYEEQPVTIKHLVTHTLGFETPPKLQAVFEKIFSGEYGLKPINYNIDQLFEELETIELVHAPGTYYNYSNVGPDLAAYILEQVYQKAYNTILQDFFDELGMKDSYLQEYATHQNRLITGHTETGSLAVVDQNPLLGGASGIITTLPDLMKYMRFLLETDEVFVKEASRSLFKNDEENMGYLWDIGYAEEEGHYFLKSGTSNGVQSILLLCPDTNYGQVLVMNNTSEKATIDWISLYNKIEYDLIKYPKINAWSKVAPLFLENPEAASKQYLELKKDTTYIAETNYLNKVGYSFLYHNKIQQAIAIFKLAISIEPENGNLYDSLGEAYLMAKNYKLSKLNYGKAFQLNPNNTNAAEKVKELTAIMEDTH